MDLSTIAIGALSVLVTIFLFIVSYRKTIGAKKERVNSTYNEIIKILVRNFVKSDYLPTVDEITRIIRSKSIENKIEVGDLPDELTFYSALYTKVAEDEILSGEKKNQLLKNVNAYLDSIREDTKIMEELEESKTYREEKERIFSFFYLALLSLLSGLMVALLSFSTVDISYGGFWENLIFMMVAMIGTVLIAISFIVLKEEQEKTEASGRTPLSKYRENVKKFQDDIRQIIENKTGFSEEPKITVDGITVRFDYAFQKDGTHYLVELRYWKNVLPKMFVNDLCYRAIKAKEKNIKAKLVLILFNKNSLGKRYINELQTYWDYVFDKEEFEDFVNGLFG